MHYQRLLENFQLQSDIQLCVFSLDLNGRAAMRVSLVFSHSYDRQPRSINMITRNVSRLVMGWYAPEFVAVIFCSVASTPDLIHGTGVNTWPVGVFVKHASSKISMGGYMRAHSTFVLHQHDPPPNEVG
jgi:hypothetical protein